MQTDAVVDLLQDRSDIAVRTGPLKDSSPIARKLGSSDAAIVAAPSYLAARAHPRSLSDFEAHDFLAERGTVA